ncbi:MAG: ABC transporter substrate-binding protein [Desulfobacterales bacterium]
MTAGGKAEAPTIRFALQDRIGSAIPIIAVRKGFFLEEGLKISHLRFSSGPACAEALYSGAADIGGMGDTTAIIMAARSSRFVIIASHATGEHRHRVMVRDDSGMRTLQDLKGRRVGVKKGTSTYGGFLAALKKVEMSAEDIDIVDLTPPTMTDALLAGSLDAFAASEPTPSAAEQKGARELTTLGGLGNQYPILILANRHLVKEQKATLRKFLQAMKKAELYVAAHPQETIAIMAKEIGLSPSTTQEAMQRHLYQLRLDSEIRYSLEQTAFSLKRQSIIPEVPDFSMVMQPDLIE